MSNLYYWHAKTSKHREMQSHDALLPFFGLIAWICLYCRAFTTRKTNPISGKSMRGSKQLWRGRSGVISILKKQLLPNPRTGKLGNVQFTGHRYFQNIYGALPGVEIEQVESTHVWLRIGQGILDSQPCSSDSHVIRFVQDLSHYM